MVPKILTVLFAFCLAFHASAQVPKNFEYGPRPPLSVFDPTGFLNPQLAKSISDPLTKIYQKEKIDVLVVVLTDLAGAPPEHVAKRFAQAWCTANIHAVVLHVPGRKDSPWIVPAGKLLEILNPKEVLKSLEEAQRRAAKEVTEPDKVKAAATEAADMLRYWTSNLINHSEQVQTERSQWIQKATEKARFRKMGLLLLAASTIPLVLGASMLILFLKNRGPRSFPSRDLQPRLGAPYSGGNFAVVKIGAPDL